MSLPDLEFIQRNARAGSAMEPAITWIGHATVLAQLRRLERADRSDLLGTRVAAAASSARSARSRRGIALADLPRIDLVLISHNHYDHLDDASVRALNAQPGGPPLFVVPLGKRPGWPKRGIDNVVELDWWQSHRASAPSRWC